MEHTIRPGLLDRKVNVAVVGAGGTGSQMVTHLGRLHHTMLALGHPGGLSVRLYDDDIISHSNFVRQVFLKPEVGNYKAPIVINKVNLGFGLNWESKIEKVSANTNLNDIDIIIGCVDTRKGRLAILEAANNRNQTYWLDCGNMLDAGQVIFGEIVPPQLSRVDRLPHVADLFPEMIDPAMDEKDDTPSCSLQEAVGKQSLLINTTVAVMACNILAQLFRCGKIKDHGCFINLNANKVNPIPICYEMWSRLGYEPSKKAA